MTYWNLLGLFGPLAPLTLPPLLLHQRCDVDPPSLEWRLCLRGGIRRLGVRGRHISEAAKGEAALGPPQPLLVEGHVLILLLQPSLGAGEVRGAI